MCRTINGPGTGPPSRIGLSQANGSPKTSSAMSLTVVSDGWFRVTPMAPSSECSSISVTERVKKGLSSSGAAISRWPLSDFMGGAGVRVDRAGPSRGGVGRGF